MAQKRKPIPLVVIAVGAVVVVGLVGWAMFQPTLPGKPPVSPRGNAAIRDYLDKNLADPHYEILETAQRGEAVFARIRYTSPAGGPVVDVWKFLVSEGKVIHAVNNWRMPVDKSP